MKIYINSSAQMPKFIKVLGQNLKLHGPSIISKFSDFIFYTNIFFNVILCLKWKFKNYQVFSIWNILPQLHNIWN